MGNHKDAVMVAFSGERFQDMVCLVEGMTIKDAAKEIGCSATTLRRAIKTGKINEKFLEKIPEVLGLDTDYYQGNTDSENVAKAVKTILDYMWKTEEGK